MGSPRSCCPRPPLLARVRLRRLAAPCAHRRSRGSQARDDRLRRHPAAVSVDRGGSRGERCGRTPRNKGLSYLADPPPIEEIVAVMRCAGPGVYGDRRRAVIVVLWRAGLRAGEALALALALAESDLDRARGAVLFRRGTGGNAGRSDSKRGGGARLTVDRVSPPAAGTMLDISQSRATSVWSTRWALASVRSDTDRFRRTIGERAEYRPTRGVERRGHCGLRPRTPVSGRLTAVTAGA